MSSKHLDRDVQEFAGDHNSRHADILRQMGVVVEDKHITYAALTEPNSLS